MKIHQYERHVLTPDAAASMVASGCDCGDGTPTVFAVADPDAPLSTITWSGVIGVEGELTGDGRYIEPNALRWEDLPIPFRYAPVDEGGHFGAQAVGRILTIERRENGDLWATGDFDDSPIGREAARVVGNGVTRGVSMDLDSVSFEIRIAKEYLEEINDDLAEDPPQMEPVESGTDDEGRVTVVAISADDEVMATTDGRVRAATLVQIPAFSRASINLDSETPAEEGEDSEESDQDEEESLVAGSAPMEPPAEWFADPVLTGPTPLTVTPDGRVYGHLAVWGTCHTAYSGQCVEPPHSPSGYAYFHTGAVLTRDGGEVPVGRVTLDTIHANRSLRPAETLAHYENTGRAVADVRAGDDVYGIWVSGALRPGLSDTRTRELRSSPLSGDWRRIGTGLELVAALAVNSPGFPVIRRPQGLVASGVMQSLVASGMLDPVPEAEVLSFDIDDMADRVVERLAQRDRAAAAALIAEQTRPARAATLARRVR